MDSSWNALSFIQFLRMNGRAISEYLGCMKLVLLCRGFPKDYVEGGSLVMSKQGLIFRDALRGSDLISFEMACSCVRFDCL